MAQDKFDLTFSGKLAPGFELEQAKANVKQLFRIDDAKAEALFSGSSIVLKKALDSETGNKYRMAMRKAGVVAFLVPSAKTAGNSPEPAGDKTGLSRQDKSEKPTQDKTEKPAHDKPEPVSQSASTNSQFTTALGAQAEAKPEPRQAIQAPNFGLAEAGSDLLQDDEKRKVEPVTVDISAISLSEQSGHLVDESEISRPEPVAVRDLAADIAPSGSDLLRPEERRKVEPVQVDISKISVAEAGERLSKPAAAPPPAPNTDHIQLEK